MLPSQPTIGVTVGDDGGFAFAWCKFRLAGFIFYVTNSSKKFFILSVHE